MFLRDDNWGYINTDAIVRWAVEESVPSSGTFVIRGYFNAADVATLNGTYDTPLAAGRVLREIVNGIDPVTRSWGGQVGGSADLRTLTGTEDTP